MDIGTANIGPKITAELGRSAMNIDANRAAVSLNIFLVNTKIERERMKVNTIGRRIIKLRYWMPNEFKVAKRR